MTFKMHKLLNPKDARYTTWHGKVFERDFDPVRKKYRQLVHEIETGTPHADLLHSAYKLGEFLQEAFGQKMWLGEEGYAKAFPKDAPKSITEAIQRIEPGRVPDRLPGYQD